ncbi:MAG: 2-C-methyl-D-erythritol 4-phosphate cytidylyltransferase, partial [Halothiobacillaceae bacterium]|nr:2-C-methyl-D-erythritol 4-phosphate cytidylyltransferase [Halothiobacillaceae bacterium]
MTPSFWWIVPAAGIGARMGADLPKQYLELAGKPVLAHTLERLLAVPGWRGLVLALSEDDRWWEGLPQAAHPGVIRCCGGRERGDSVLNALRVLDGRAKERDWVLVHDAARPCLRVRDVQRLLAA